MANQPWKNHLIENTKRDISRELTKSGFASGFRDGFENNSYGNLLSLGLPCNRLNKDFEDPHSYPEYMKAYKEGYRCGEQERDSNSSG